ncbi:hypothetical protein PM082_009401 [Marasmius tenuissimus]|nr:hypothetical protein PM082_009401 [Marasmius tenuissimus]
MAEILTGLVNPLSLPAFRIFGLRLRCRWVDFGGILGLVPAGKIARTHKTIPARLITYNPNGHSYRQLGFHQGQNSDFEALLYGYPFGGILDTTSHCQMLNLESGRSMTRADRSDSLTRMGSGAWMVGSGGTHGVRRITKFDLNVKRPQKVVCPRIIRLGSLSQTIWMGSRSV